MIHQIRGRLARFLAATVAASTLLVLLPISAAAAAPPPSCQIDPQCDAFRPIFFGDFAPPDGQPSASIFRVNPDGTGRTVIIRDAAGPSVDRGRTKIAFIRAREVWIAKIDGSGQQRLTEVAAEGPVFSVSLSPDGNYVAYTQGPENVIVVRLIGAASTCDGLSDSDGGPLRGVSPIWSPDGVHLAYAERVEGGVGYFVARCDGTDQREVLRRSNGSPAVDWSPDGRRLVLDTDQGISWVDVQAPGIEHPVPNTAAVNGIPTWSPDGDRIAMARVQVVPTALWTVRLDGTDAQKIASLETFGGSKPDWGYPAAPVVGLP